MHKLSAVVPRIGTPFSATAKWMSLPFRHWSGTSLMRRSMVRLRTVPWADLPSISGAFDEALRYLKIAECATGAPYVSKLGPEEVAGVHAILDRNVKPYLSKNVSR